jgi:hypothetical protein
MTLRQARSFLRTDAFSRIERLFRCYIVASIEPQQAGGIMAALILIVDDNDQLRGVFAPNPALVRLRSN